MDTRLPLLTLLIYPQLLFFCPSHSLWKQNITLLDSTFSTVWNGKHHGSLASAQAGFIYCGLHVLALRSEICQVVFTMITFSFKEWCVLNYMSMSHIYFRLAFDTRVPNILGTLMLPPVRWNSSVTKSEMRSLLRILTVTLEGFFPLRKKTPWMRTDTISVQKGHRTDNTIQLLCVFSLLLIFSSPETTDLVVMEASFYMLFSCFSVNFTCFSKNEH